MRISRRAAFVFVLALIAPACNRADVEEQLNRYLNGLEGTTLEYIYTEEAQGTTTEIKGVIEDTFRHQETLMTNKVEVLERVTLDDSIAIRLFVTDQLPQLFTTADESAAQAVEALKTGQWVVDPEGAPPLSGTAEQASTNPLQATDPLSDALGIQLYLRQAVNAALGVIIFNPDSLSYRPDLDPFPHPDRDAGEQRYDLVAPPLPRRDDAQQQLPVNAHFRKMAFYVKSGRLTMVREEVDIEAHEEVVRARQTGRNIHVLEMALAVREGRGQERIREREMTWQIVSRGTPVTIDFPQGVVNASLKTLFAPPAQTAQEGLPAASEAPPVPPDQPTD